MEQFEIWGHGDDIESVFTQSLTQNDAVSAEVGKKASSGAFTVIERPSGMSARKLIDHVVAVAEDDTKIKKVSDGAKTIVQDAVAAYVAEDGPVLVIEPSYVERKDYKAKERLARTRTNVYALFGRA